AELTGNCVAAAEALLARGMDAVRAQVAPDGAMHPDLLEREQHAVHGLAWLATYVEALRQIHDWSLRLDEQGRLGELDRLIVRGATGEYLARIAGGIPMSQGEIARLHQLHVEAAAISAFADDPAVRRAVVDGTAAPLRTRLATLIADGEFGDWGLDDTLDMVREQFRRFAEEQIVPNAHGWHALDQLIPLELVEALAGLGVFGLTVPEAWGGLGMGKAAMCVVTEELSRGYIGVGSLGTRSEIAAELIRQGGTDAQRAKYLPRIASGEIIPTAVFTEPDTGSDLAALQTRAVPYGDGYRLTGSKTWITHAARADLMTILCRTDPSRPGHRGLSILLAEKPRGSDAEPFPVAGLSGSEIPVLGYRGMKEYTLAFDRFAVPRDGLLGGSEGRGFKQLMATFESARIQTAARAVGVARSALEAALGYARERIQFGKPIFAFPRVADKLVGMAVETMVARQLTLFAAREKDADRRCDLEAGMAKLLAAQVAWSAADNAVQIHGGNGYALEYPISRIFCDARILNIFEGAAEIQAQIIGRRLLGT
ncbi:MAG TPA: acyl-CoA dehydrogenase family protein, partial [Geminicoccaceae bacterium]|nr:acyl-CoA dehydrogenase family protein [Geminicoccaceae bacterium]